MNVLKRKLMLLTLEHEPSVPKLELCEKLVPYLRHYGITLTDEGIVFPAECSSEQKLIQVVSAPYVYQEQIPYESVIRVEGGRQSLLLTLRTGHLFLFDVRSPVWKIYNICNYGEPMPITSLWWGISGKLVFLWWKVRAALGCPQKKKA